MTENIGVCKLIPSYSPGDKGNRIVLECKPGGYTVCHFANDLASVVHFFIIHTIQFTHDSYTIHVGNRGRFVLPAEVRHQLDLKEGDRLILTVEQDELCTLSVRGRSLTSCRGCLPI